MNKVKNDAQRLEFCVIFMDAMKVPTIPIAQNSKKEDCNKKAMTTLRTIFGITAVMLYHIFWVQEKQFCFTAQKISSTDNGVAFLKLFRNEASRNPHIFFTESLTESDLWLEKNLKTGERSIPRVTDFYK